MTVLLKLCSVIPINLLILNKKFIVLCTFSLTSTLSDFMIHINPNAPVAQIITDKVVFRRFQGEGVEFNHTNKPLITSFYIKKDTYFLPN